MHRPLLVAWALVIAAFATGVLGGLVELVVLPQFAAMALAVMTVKRAERTGQLRRVCLYRAALALLLAAAGTCLIAAGSTVLVGGELGGNRTLGFIALASTNLVIAVLAWRALVTPAPRRAALAGVVAVVVELIALIVDALSNLRSDVGHHTHIAISIFASVAATWAGALVCMAAVGTFDRSELDVPSARVVDDH